MTFYEKPTNSIQSNEVIVANPFISVLIVSVFAFLIIYLGYRDFKKNQLLNKEVKGKITTGNCKTDINRVYNSRTQSRGVSSKTSCIVSYKYTVDNQEYDGVYTGDMFTETQVGKEVTIYYNDKEPTYSSMKKNRFTGLFIMFFGLLIFGLIIYSQMNQQSSSKTNN